MGCLRKRGQIDARTDSRTARENIETGRAVSFAEAEEHGSLSSVVSGKDSRWRQPSEEKEEDQTRVNNKTSITFDSHRKIYITNITTLNLRDDDSDSSRDRRRKNRRTEIRKKPVHLLST